MLTSNTPTARALPPGRQGAGGRARAGSIDEPVRPRRLAGQTLEAFLGLSAFLAAFAFLAGAAEDFDPVAVEGFGAVAVEDLGADADEDLGADAVAVFTALPAADRDAAGFAAVPALLVLVAVVELADSPLAASLSDATAVSRALVAVLIAVSAVVSALADVPAWVAAVFSFVAAVDTLVAAAVTVRGVTALVRVTAAVLLAAVRPAPFLLAAVLLAPVLLAPVLLAAPVLVAAVLLVVGRAAARVLVAVAGLAAAARVEAGLLAASVVPGMVAVVFVGTDLPPDMDQLRGRHSTESNLLHLMTRKNNGKTAISVT